MMEKTLCKIFGINVKESNTSLTIDMSQMAKKHPNLTKKVLKRLADEMTKEGVTVNVVSEES